MGPKFIPAATLLTASALIIGVASSSVWARPQATELQVAAAAAVVSDPCAYPHPAFAVMAQRAWEEWRAKCEPAQTAAEAPPPQADAQLSRAEVQAIARGEAQDVLRNYDIGERARRAQAALN